MSTPIQPSRLGPRGISPRDSDSAVPYQVPTKRRRTPPDAGLIVMGAVR